MIGFRVRESSDFYHHPGKETFSQYFVVLCLLCMRQGTGGRRIGGQPQRPYMVGGEGGGASFSVSQHQSDVDQ